MKQPPNSTRDGSERKESKSRLPQVAGALLAMTGLAHLLAPTTLLGLAERGYSTVLNVDFDPRPGASKRVRALGIGLLAAGAHLLYYNGVLPSGD